MMRLTTKINLFFVTALAGALVVCTISFLVMLRTDRQQNASKTSQRIDAILDGQMLMFTRDMSRGDIELAKLRANLIEAAYREEGVKIELRDPSDRVLYASEGLTSLRRMHVQSSDGFARNWSLLGDHVLTARALTFNGIDLGILTIAALSRPESKSFFQNTIIIVFLIISTMSVAGMVLTRMFVNHEVIRPLARLVRDVKDVNRFVAGEQDYLPPIPGKIGAEMRILYDSLWQSSRDLRTAVDEKGKALLRLEREQALSRTVQMLAHDVRKPFSMFKIILDSLTASTDFAQMKSFVRQAKKDVLDALQSVEGMIQDIMEIGIQSAPTTDPEEPSRLVETALNLVFRLSDRTDISFSYRWNHSHQVLVDPLKVRRVLINVLHNAVDAMKGRGHISIETEDFLQESKAMVRFSIGNDGPGIPQEHIPSLFEAFFTSGKKGGTGLGLAIAKRIVRAHGGDIWCESGGDRGVAFHFTLAAALETPAAPESVMPSNSREVFETSQFLAYSPSSSASADEITLEHEFLTKSGNRKIRLLIADDETLYRSAIEGQIRQNKEVAARVEVLSARNAEETIREALRFQPDILIQDIDLGRGEADGFEVVRSLRDRGLRSHICIHSNRGMFQYQEMSIRAGANAFLPKPLSRIHLLKMLTGVLQATNIDGSPAPFRDPALDWPTPSRQMSGRTGEIILVEDADIIRMAWEAKLEGSLRAYSHPEALLADWKKDPELLTTCEAILLDNDYGHLSSFVGIDLAKTLRSETHRPIFLYSENEIHPLPDCFDGYLPKNTYSLQELRQEIERVITARRDRAP